MAKGPLLKEEQSKLKGLSKVISFLANLGRICIFIGIGAIILCMLIMPTIIKHVKTYDNTIELKYSEETLKIVRESDEQVRVYINDKKEDKITDVEGFDKLYKVLDKHSNKTIIGYFEAIFLLIILYMYLANLVLKHLSKLFKNIKNGDTPFTLDNVDHMKKMGIYMIAAIVLPPLFSIIFNACTDLEFNLSFDLIDIVQILFVFAMAFVFRYGYNLQEDSKKTIYDDED